MASSSIHHRYYENLYGGDLLLGSIEIQSKEELVNPKDAYVVEFSFIDFRYTLLLKLKENINGVSLDFIKNEKNSEVFVKKRVITIAEQSDDCLLRCFRAFLGAPKKTQSYVIKISFESRYV